MQHYQDTETGQIHGFDDGIDPFTLGFRSIPKTLSATIKPKPSADHVWLNGDWIHNAQVPSNYCPPVSNVPSYDPAWHAFLQPYTWVLRDDEEFGINLEQINANTYAGEMLSEPVTSLLAMGVPALISRDGAFALPMKGDFAQQHHAVEMLNRLFCGLLIGGIHAEFVAHNQVLVGSLGEDGRLYAYTPTQHGRYRYMDASISERIALMHPRVIRVSQLHEALDFGLGALTRIENFSPSFLLHGYTALCHQNLAESLSSLWIVVEQLTAFLWKNTFLGDPKLNPQGMKGRLEGMKNDNRTWTTSVKHELLWQVQVLSSDSYARLNDARRQRNGLVHDGQIPNLESVTGLWPAICELLGVASESPMERLAGMGIWNHQLSTRVGKTNFDSWDSMIKKLA